MDFDEFVRSHGPEENTEAFERESSKMLDISLDGSIMAKAGSMIGYTGDISFERKSSGGLKGMLKKRVTGEGTVMMRASGNGHLYLADAGKEVQILELDADDEVSVNGNDVLALEESVNWDIKMMSSIAGSASGGLFNVYLKGPGHIAITTHGEPLVLPTPVRTDPNATVAWSANVSPSAKRDLNIKSFIGRSSGESFQLEFAGQDGFVIVQPYEEINPDGGDAGGESSSAGQGVSVSDFL
ncbi:AIM24 family protein [Halococcus sediminicola]|uniref:AIM24 family protein n=1 Tax=Halococcus sediminicola TaxID=1264579 RepID=UPI0006789569|nr:AIM24 family protein [Halococcus sediminicola]